jgi:hypothetical protein
MSALWIEFDASDDSGSVRWGNPVTDEQIDLIVTYAEKVIGRTPETVA